MNRCIFSDDEGRHYRYTLEHVWDELQPERLVMWIGLNPSTADENQLDPTLRRIRSFSQRMGFTGFVMTNLFAFRATDPRVMKLALDPVGPRNEELLRATAARCAMIVACWGAHGSHLNMAKRADVLLAEHDIWCLGTNGDGSPKHPLYVPGNAVLYRWEGGPQ